MARVNVFLTLDLLRAIDTEAARAGLRRSAFVQAALTQYLDRLRKEREDAAARLEMEEAGRGMDSLAERLGAWDPVKVIREFRDSRSLVVHERSKGYRARRPKDRG